MILFSEMTVSGYPARDFVEFEDFIEHSTGYTNAGKRAFTDIVTLCKSSESCCGVNLSVGYYDEHTSYETLNIAEWTNTLKIMADLIIAPALL